MTKRYIASSYTVADVLAEARMYIAQPGNIAGGSLHLVLDDGNVDDDDVRCCIEFALENGDEDGIRLALALINLTPDEREEVYNSL